MLNEQEFTKAVMVRAAAREAVATATDIFQDVEDLINERQGVNQEARVRELESIIEDRIQAVRASYGILQVAIEKLNSLRDSKES